MYIPIVGLCHCIILTTNSKSFRNYFFKYSEFKNCFYCVLSVSHIYFSLFISKMVRIEKTQETKVLSFNFVLDKPIYTIA